MSETPKCPLCGGAIYHEAKQNTYVCERRFCPYIANIIAHHGIVEMLAARDAEIAKLRALLERVDGIVVSHDVLAWRRLKDDIRAALATRRRQVNRDFSEPTSEPSVKMVLVKVDELRQLTDLADGAMAVRPHTRWSEGDVSKIRARVRAIQGRLRAWQRGAR